MKIIFLDINGMLDTYDKIDETNQTNLQRLKTIVDETGAQIVISSSLKNSYYYTGTLSRKLKDIIRQLEEVGIEVIDITPHAKTIEEEIKMYLDMHPEIENFCIIDDNYEMESLKENLVKLPSQMNEEQMGLDDMHMNMAIRILTKQ